MELQEHEEFLKKQSELFFRGIINIEQFSLRLKEQTEKNLKEKEGKTDG